MKEEVGSQPDEVGSFVFLLETLSQERFGLKTFPDLNERCIDELRYRRRVG